MIVAQYCDLFEDLNKGEPFCESLNYSSHEVTTNFEKH
jgi:hypothetical protein